MMQHVSTLCDCDLAQIGKRRFSLGELGVVVIAPSWCIGRVTAYP